MHCVTPAIFANSPGGSVAVIPDSSLSESERENVSVNGEYAPAVGFVVPAVNDGANGVGLAQPVMLNDEDGLAIADPYAVIVDVVVNVPQLSGLASAASGPLKNFRFRSLNGSCGLPLNTAVN